MKTNAQSDGVTLRERFGAFVRSWREVTSSIAAARELRKKDPAHEYMQRPARYVNIDGGVELAWGMFILSAALIVYMGSRQPKPLWQQSVSALLLVVMMGGPWAIPKLVKKFVTWPRTGYMALDTNTPNMRMGRTIGIVLGLLGGVGLSLLIAAERQNGFFSPKSVVGVLVLLLVLVVGFWCFRVKKACDKSLEQAIPPIKSEHREPMAAPSLIPSEKLQRRIKLGVFGMFFMAFIVAPVVFGGLIYLWFKFVAPTASLSMSQMITTLIALVCNPILYLMVNAISFKEHVWKWFAFVALAMGPLAILTMFPEVWKTGAESQMGVPNVLSFFIALTWIVSGAGTLILYMLHHHRPAESVE